MTSLLSMCEILQSDYPLTIESYLGLRLLYAYEVGSWELGTFDLESMWSFSALHHALHADLDVICHMTTMACCGVLVVVTSVDAADGAPDVEC